MSDRLLRRQEVEQLVGLSRSSIYRLMQIGRFPLPLKIGPSAVRWKESELTTWIETRPPVEGEVGNTSGPPESPV